MSVEAKIFISYSRRNRDFAERLFNALKSRGYDPWVDFDDIPFSVDWWAEIKAAIDRHDIVISVISDHSLISRVCNEEITYAREHNKRIIPLIAADIDIKHVVGELYEAPYEMAARDNWKYIRTLNWIHFYREQDDFEKGVDNIIGAIETDHSHLRNHTRILTRAMEWKEYEQGRGFLLRGEELIEAEEWLAQADGKEPEPLSLHHEYVKLSREVQTEEEKTLHEMRRQTRTLRRASVGMIVTAVVVISGILLALFNTTQRGQALQATTVAIQSTSTAVFQDQQAAIDLLNRQSRQANALRLAIEAQNEWENGDLSLLALRLGLTAYDIIEEGEPPLRVQRIVSENVYRPGLVRFFTPPATNPDTACHPPAQREFPYLDGPAHQQSVSAVQIAQQRQRVISAGLDRCVYIWDTTDGSLLVSLDAFETRITALALSPDESQFAVGETSGRVSLWSLDGTLIHDLTNNGHQQRVTGLAFSGQGRYLLSGSLDTRGLLWDTNTGEVTRTLEAHEGRISAVAANPNTLEFASGDTNGVLFLWRLDADQDGLPDADDQVMELAGAHQSAVTDIQFSDSGQLLSTALDDTVIYWTNPSSALFQEIDTEIGAPIEAAAFLDNRYGLFATQDGELLLWDLTQTDIIGEVDSIFLPYQNSLLTALAVSDSNTFGIVGLDNGMVLQIDLENGAIQQKIQLHAFPVQNSVIQPGGTVVSRELNEDIVLWTPGTTEIRRYSLADLGVGAAVLAPDGTYALGPLIDDDQALYRVNLNTLEPTRYPDEVGFINHPQAPTPDGVATSFSADGTLALSRPVGGVDIGEGITVFDLYMLWNPTTGEILRERIDLLSLIGSDRLSMVQFNMDGSRLLLVEDQSIVHIVDTQTLEPVRTPIDRNRTITTAAYGAPGYETKLILGYADGTVGFLDLAKDEWIDIRGHDASVVSIDLYVQGDTLLAATSSAGRSVIVWDVFAHEPIRYFQPRTRGETSVQFSADGEALITQSGDLQAVVWRLDSSQQLIDWATENRHVPPLTPNTCDAFQIPAPCGD